MDEATLKEIEKLGEVKHIVRACSGHGSDDPFYITRYHTRVWASKTAKWEDRFQVHGDIEVTDDLAKGCPAPFDDIEVLCLSLSHEGRIHPDPQPTSCR